MTQQQSESSQTGGTTFYVEVSPDADHSFGLLLLMLRHHGSRTVFSISLTLQSCTASSMGEQLCVLCSLEVPHTTQMGRWSSRQNSFSLSPCRLQLSFSSRREFCLLTCRTASQTFFRAKFEGTLDFETFFLHTGHSRRPDSQQHFRQCRQKLWLHGSKTGSEKMSQHTGQVRSSSGSDIIITSSCLFTKIQRLEKRTRRLLGLKSRTTLPTKTYLNLRRGTFQPKASRHRNCPPIVLDAKWSMLSCLRRLRE